MSLDRRLAPLAVDPLLSAGALAAMAPSLVEGEALSGWMARIAKAHMLTLDELSRMSGLSPILLDRRDPRQIAILADLTAQPLAAPRSLSWPLGADFTLGPALPGNWAVCMACLAGDVNHRRIVYLRSCWVHPLAGYCPDHDAPLVAHDPRDPLGQALDGYISYRKAGGWCHLGHLVPEERRPLRALAMRLEGPDTRTARRRAREIYDVVAALALSSVYAFPGGVLDRLHSLWGLPPVGIRAQRLDPEQILMLDAADRLVFLRAALRLLAGPSKALARPGSWLDRYLRLRG